MPLFLIIILIFVTGSIIGSFLNVLIHRIKKEDYKGILMGRSACPNCHKKIEDRDLMPLLSFILLKGKSRCCKNKISFHYFLTELITACTFLFAFFSFPAALDTRSNTIFFVLILFYLTVLIFTCIYDFLYLEVADIVMIPSIVVAIIALLHPLSPDPKSALYGAALIFAFFYGQILISNGRWLGGGDLRIGFFMGLILGLQNSIVALIASYLIGSLISIVLISSSRLKLKSEIPFAPFLCFGTFIALYYGNTIANWYLSQLGINL